MNELISADYFPRLHTALAEGLMCVAMVLPLRVRAVKWRRAAVVALLWALLTANFCLMERLGVQRGWWLAQMLLAMGLMLLMLFAGQMAGWRRTLYTWAHAFLYAEAAASLEWQINHLLIRSGAVTTIAQTYICMGVVYAAIFACILQRRRRGPDDTGEPTTGEALSAAGIAVGAFLISNLQFALPDDMLLEALGGGVFYARTLVDLSGLIMLYASEEQRRELRMRYELDATRSLLRRQYEQYRQFEANNEAMHRVYHDLKHQIAYLESESSREERLARLSEMKETIRVSESRVDTGNTALDTLLTSKSLLCADEGITMTCYADANLLDFMDVMDLCCIFGNAIDNAIEHERTEPDPEDRIIRLQVSAKGDFLRIRIENYCSAPVVFVEGAPVTTKEDKQLHGYGLKSMRRSVEKYRGCINVEQQEDWFTVTILVPLPKGQTAESTV